jgi:hypothetical protein
MILSRYGVQGEMALAHVHEALIAASALVISAMPGTAWQQNLYFFYVSSMAFYAPLSCEALSLEL